MTTNDLQELKFPLNDAQLEIMKTFAFGLRKAEFNKLRSILFKFKDEVLQNRIDEEVSKGNWVKLQKAK
ncbi:MAG: hypothetical protein IK017_01420 [Paludibacteraceae bacterium]|nr:hypothetical protein [Paludibacteraceae bacterium]